MLNPDEIREWIKKAENDFDGALYLSRRRKKPLPDLVCFHCQQSAEKYLKAFLILNNSSFPKTHDLIVLLNLYKKYDPDLELYLDLFEYINPYSVQFRYPGDEVDISEAKNAIKQIKKIRKIMRMKFPAYLFDIEAD
ncbi:HEPN domain-containing protein [candidate division KSB1 bacterium]|nr:HEPN domain-containing protein [candidate division KSB1 bacterium]